MPKYNPNSIWDGAKKKNAQFTPTKEYGPSFNPKAPPNNPGGTASTAPTAQPLQSGPQSAIQEHAVAAKYNEKFKQEPPPRKSRAIIWSIALFAIVVLGGLFYFFLRPPAGLNVSIGFTKPDQILMGDPFQLEVSLSNYSSNILKNATLSLFLPDNVSFAGQSSGQRVMEQSVGDVGPGSINKQTFNIIVTGDPNTIKHLTTKLTYATDANVKAQYETDGSLDLVIGGPAISLNFNVPPNIFSGQNFDMTISYNNNTGHSFQNVELGMQYPPVYSFANSTMAPDSAGKNSWNLGTISAAGAGTLTVTGNLVGPPNGIYAMNGNLSGQVLGNTYTLTSQTANLTVGSSPLELSASLNNGGGAVAKPGDTLNYVISYTNNSNVTFQNLAVSASLVGAMYDFASLRSDGSFNSITNTVNWNAANAPALLTVGPGQSGSVSFQIKVKSGYPIRLLSDKNYSLKLAARISSPTVPPGTVASSTVSATTLENKVAGQVSLAAKGYWRDAPSGILNSGPYPPKVNQPTQYTVHWIITNYSTDLQGVTVSASLQSGTTCTGKITSNIAAVPICNPQNGQVTWQIPQISATAGVLGAAPEAIIQVQNTPAINQVGQPVTLISDTTLQAVDGFTGATMQASAPAVTTDIPDDKTIPANQNRRVTQ